MGVDPMVDELGIKIVKNIKTEMNGLYLVINRGLVMNCEKKIINDTFDILKSISDLAVLKSQRNIKEKQITITDKKVIVVGI